MSEKDPKVLVMIPAFNEQASITRVLDAVVAQDSRWDIAVIDDGSSDQTGQVVERAAVGAQVLSLPFNVGVGPAVSLGFLYAQQQGYDVVVRIDADGQHDTACIADVLKPILNEEADMCIGSRFIGEFKDGYQASFIRRIGINFFAWLITLLIGQKVTDPTSGFNAFGPWAFGLFVEHYPLDYPEPEAIVIAKRAGLRVKEVPVKMNQRLAGISSIRYLKTLYYMINVSLAIMLNYLRPKKAVSH